MGWGGGGRMQGGEQGGGGRGRLGGGAWVGVVVCAWLIHPTGANLRGVGTGPFHIAAKAHIFGFMGIRDRSAGSGLGLDSTMTAPAGVARILVVEDRGIVAAKVARALTGAGHAVAGMAPTLREAFKQAGALAGDLDAAVLDIDLRGETVYPFAAALRDRGVPFVFLTGYGAPAVAACWRNVIRVEKPFEAATLLRALGDAMAGRGAEPRPGEPAVVTPTIRRAWDTMRHTRDIITEARAFRELLGQREAS